MPYSDLEKRKQANRESMRRARRGTQGPMRVDPDVYPNPVRCWHCGSWHETVQACRDCPNDTDLGRWCATYATSVWARRPDKRALPDLAAISKSLAEVKLGEHVRFGVEGPTFGEIAAVLGPDVG